MLSLDNIEFNYSNRNSFKIEIPNVSFKTFSITCILGKNGSGKTTLLNLIGGHIKMQHGTIMLYDKNISDAPAEERPTSTLFQQIGLFPHLTVRQNIEIAIEPNTLFKKSSTTIKKADNIIADFSLQEMVNNKPGQISVGQQQRVGLARALSSNPKVLLLDEPTSALDFVNISYLKKTLFEIRDNKTADIIIVVSHDLHFVLEIADRILFMEEGELVFEGNGEEFKKSIFYIV